MKKGLLIAFDGLDSSGKATQVRELVLRLEQAGHRVRHWQTPDYTTPSGQELQQRLQGKLGDWAHTPWEQKMRFFAANRAEHTEEVRAALAAGEIVVYDRYVASSLAFITIEALSAQEAGLYREKIHEAVRREEYTKHGMPQENVSVFLDVLPEVAMALLANRKKANHHDNEYTDHLVIQERLYKEYDWLSRQRPEHFLRIKCVEGTELLSIPYIAELVWEGLTHRFVGLHKK